MMFMWEKPLVGPGAAQRDDLSLSDSLTLSLSLSLSLSLRLLSAAVLFLSTARQPTACAQLRHPRAKA